MFDLIAEILDAVFFRNYSYSKKDKEIFAVFPIMITFMIVALAIFSPFQFVWLFLILPLFSVISKFLWPDLEKNLWYKVIVTFLLVIIFIVTSFMLVTYLTIETTQLINEI